MIAGGSLAGKKIVIVGGCGLLGKEIVSALCNEGVNCIIADCNTETSTHFAEDVSSRGKGKAFFIKTNIENKISVDAMIQKAVELFGGIDGLINSAYPRNQQYGKKFEDVEYADFCENVSLHLGGYFLVSQRILEYFKINNGGTLLNISSIYGVIAPRFKVYQGTSMTMPVEYAAIKSAIVHLTRYMAKYYAGHSIRVNALSLGGLKDRQPDTFLEAYRDFCLNKGMLDPSDIIGTILFLMSDCARYINGQNLIVDDGFTL
jgi:NAD(P)-dependent dehydrogenase (short-subunit alcohol dehydrogenase family)